MPPRTADQNNPQLDEIIGFEIERKHARLWILTPGKLLLLLSPSVNSSPDFDREDDEDPGMIYRDIAMPLLNLLQMLCSLWSKSQMLTLA